MPVAVPDSSRVELETEISHYKGLLKETESMLERLQVIRLAFNNYLFLRTHDLAHRHYKVKECTITSVAALFFAKSPVVVAKINALSS